MGNVVPVNNKSASDEWLDSIYQIVLDGLLDKNVYTIAKEYLGKYSTIEAAADDFINNQILKCGTSGFLTGLGGLITLPVAVPVNVSSVLYFQLRMIAVLAVMGGYDPRRDEIKTTAYLCLIGSAASDCLKPMGIKVGSKMAENFIRTRISREVLTKINKAVGFRLITKAGEKGVVNLTKCIPILGGLIGGGFDAVSTATIAEYAKEQFIK